MRLGIACKSDNMGIHRPHPGGCMHGMVSMWYGAGESTGEQQRCGSQVHLYPQAWMPYKESHHGARNTVPQTSRIAWPCHEMLLDLTRIIDSCSTVSLSSRAQPT